MFTSGDVLFPEIFEITLGSEKGKYLLPEDICLSTASQKFNLFTDRQRRGRGFAPVFRRLRNRLRHRPRRVYCARAKSRPDDSVHLVLPYSCAGYRLPFQTLSNSVSWRHNVCIVVSNLSSRTADCR